MAKIKSSVLYWLLFHVILTAGLIPIQNDDIISNGLFYRDDSTGLIYTDRIVIKFSQPVVNLSPNVRTYSLSDFNNQYQAIIEYFDSLNIVYGIESINKTILAATPNDLDRTHKWTGESVTIPDLSQLFTCIFTVPINPKTIQDKLLKYSEIEYVHEPMLIVKYDTPNDVHFLNGDQWYLDVIHAEQAWDITTGNEEVIVGVIDLGAYSQHPDLLGEISWDDGNIDYHGTMIAGIIGAKTNNVTGIASVGRDIKIHSYGYDIDSVNLTNEFASVVAENIYVATEQCDVMNFSWGTYKYVTESDMSWVSPDCPNTNAWINTGSVIPASYEEVEAVISIAQSLGVSCVASSGNRSKNSGLNVELCDPMRIPFISYPAAYPKVIAVSGTMLSNTGSEVFNHEWNYGSFVDFAAPGKDIFSTGSIDGYLLKSGTSFSSPQVTALVALLIGLNQESPYWSNNIIKKIMSQTSTSLNVDDCPEMDYYNISGWNHCLGYGRINTYLALDITSRAPQPPSGIRISGRIGQHPIIRWDFSNEPDVVKYKIYRERYNVTEHVGTVESEIKEFVDLSFIIEGGGEKARYSVTAVDVIQNESSHSNQVSTKGSETTAGRTVEMNVVPILNTFEVDSNTINAQTFLNDENILNVIYNKSPKLNYQKFSLNGESIFDSTTEIPGEYSIATYDSEIKDDIIYLFYETLFAPISSWSLERVMINSFGEVLYHEFMGWGSKYYYPNISIINDTTLFGVWINDDDKLVTQPFDLSYQVLGNPYILLSYQNDPEMEIESHVNLAHNENNNLLMTTWYDSRSEDLPYNIMGHLFNENRESIGPSFIINSPHQSFYPLSSDPSKSLFVYGDSFIYPYMIRNTDVSKWELYLAKLSYDDGQVINNSIFVTQLDSIHFSYSFRFAFNENGYGIIMWDKTDYEFPVLYSSSISGILIEPGLEVQQGILDFVDNDSIPKFKFVSSVAMNTNYATFTYIDVDDINEGINALKTGVIAIDSLFTSMNAITPTMPELFSLSTYPNPFNNNLMINISVAKADLFRIRIVNILGEEVYSFSNTNFIEGSHSLLWDGIDINGKYLPSGVYFIVVNSNHQVHVEKVTFLK